MDAPKISARQGTGAILGTQALHRMASALDRLLLSHTHLSLSLSGCFCAGGWPVPGCPPSSEEHPVQAFRRRRAGGRRGADGGR